MSISEKDAALRERKAFAAGARCLYTSQVFGPTLPLVEIEAEAVARYPLPKVTRPRVIVTATCGEWRFVDGHYEQRDGPVFKWSQAPSDYVIPIGQAADVLALRDNPTEEIEAKP